MDSISTAGTPQWWKNIDIRGSLSLFLGALPLFVLWLTLPLFLLIISSLYQSERLLTERQDRMRDETPFPFTSSNGENYTLYVSFPHRLRIDPDVAYDDSLVVWLTGPAPSPNATLPAYTFALRPESEALDFTDETGRPIPGIIRLALTPDGVDSRALYLRANPALVDAGENLIISVEGLPPALGMRPVEVAVEGLWASRRRHFFDAFFSLPTVIGGLLTAIAGFGFQQWNALNARRQREEEELQRTKQKEDDEACAKLEAAFGRSDYHGAFGLRQQCLRRGNGLTPRFENMFEERISQAIDYEFDHSNFPQAIALYHLILNAKLDQLKSKWDYCKHKTVSSLLIRDLSKAKRLIDELVKHALASETETAHYNELEQGVAHVKLTQLLRVHPEIVMKRNDHLYNEHGDVKRGMDLMRMDANPFGSEKVEGDLRFDGRFDRVIWRRDISLEGLSPAILEYINTIYSVSVEEMHSQSQLFLGPKGSGKTAVALLIAGLSFLRKDKVLPVYCRISSKDDAHSLLRQVASVLLHYYVSNCLEFRELDTTSQSAISVLLANYLASGSELSFRLKIAGLSKEPLSDDFHNQLMAITDLAKSVKLTCHEAARVLSQICPPEYKRLLFIFDHQDNATRLSAGNAKIVEFMADLQQAGAILKVFSVPSAFSGAVSKRVQLSILTLYWDETKIRQVLENQMKNCEFAGLGIFFDPSLRSVSRDLLVKASKDGPGKLVHIGNEILAQIGRNARPLNHKDAETIFGKVLVRKVLKESSR